MRASILFALAAAAGSSPAAAQWQAAVPPGSRVRVTTNAAKQEQFRGMLVSPIRDTVAMQAQTGKFLRPGPVVPRAFSLSSVGRLDVSEGRAHAQGALRGAAYGAAASLGYGGLVWVASKLGGGGIYAQQTKVDAWRSTWVSAMGLVPICTLIWGLNAPDKWQRVYPAP